MIQDIQDALDPLGLTVAFQDAGDAGYPRITFFFFNESGAAYADDEEIATNHSLQVDIWSKGGYTSITEEVKGALKAIGYRRSFAADLYEEDTKIFHKVLRFRYTAVV